MEGRSAAMSAVAFWTPGRFCCGRAHPHLTTYHGQEGSSFFPTPVRISITQNIFNTPFNQIP